MEWLWGCVEWIKWQRIGVSGYSKNWMVWYMGRGEERRLTGVKRGERGEAGRVMEH